MLILTFHTARTIDNRNGAAGVNRRARALMGAALLRAHEGTVITSGSFAQLRLNGARPPVKLT
jgi:hypothetical protein